MKKICSVVLKMQNIQHDFHVIFTVHFDSISSIITKKCTFLYFCYTFTLHMFRLWSSHPQGYTSMFTSLALVRLVIITRHHNVLVFVVSVHSQLQVVFVLR
jgi:hypothetical protein